ncbi:acetate--CoA ligase [Candidatus Microgenomates bacterium]|nr:acetate--CoA ligase [Candidatus Microgenomates bacterium]
MSETILKPKSYFRVSPNLADYDKMRRNFRWADFEKELEWFPGKKLNAAYNAIDRNALNWRKNKIALYWVGENGEKEKYTFTELSALSSKFANALKSLGVDRGDRVFFFLPRVPQLYIGFLGTLKMGAIAGTMFAAFGPQAIEDRLGNSGAKILVTNKELKPRVDQVKKNLPHLEKVIVIENDWEKLLSSASDEIRVARTDPEDPAFMLYTSGTTGKPKGVVHVHRAILHEHMTAKWVLDIREDDVYWCTADPGWVTGIAYEILGSWSNGSSTLVHSGRFDPEIWYSLIQEYKVNVWYTAPTAVRMLAAAGLGVARKYDFSSLRHICSVGEPLNPEPIRWGLKAFGLPFHDNWWQTETGGILMANYPCMPIRLGSMGKPFPGITASIVDDNGKELAPGKEGNLAIRPGWPSMMKTIWRRPEKYRSYFKKGWYISGDRAWRDKDGYFWFIGRADDVIKTGGERVGPFEVESALVEHPGIVEAGVIGKPDKLRGEIIKAFIVLTSEQKAKIKTKKDEENFLVEIQTFIKKHLAGHAYPREIEFIDKLPKTRSGKIMRRILKAKELGLPIGDTSTLEEY